ncbi:MAG: MFS transporter [Pseudoclavibacter sp.]
MAAINKALDTAKTPRDSKRESRRVYFAAVIGTTFEWYDFFIYSTAGAIVFTELFFAPAGERFGTLITFATFGLSFLFRPLGAFLAGHLGDRFGRKIVLTLTLVLMGAATTLIGLLPTYEQLGIAAPILLILLRILQGLSAGGEWGGAALLAVEHSPSSRRGWFGAAPQIGVPLGLLLANGALALMRLIAPGDAFIEWGWRVPFIVSILLVAVGFFIRRSVSESPVFAELAKRSGKRKTGSPILELFRRFPLRVLMSALLMAGASAVGYMTTGYVQNYATQTPGPGMDLSVVLWIVSASGLSWLLFTLLGAVISDRINRKRTYLIGWGITLVGVLAMFPLIDTGEPALLALSLLVLTLGLGFATCAQPALYAEAFPASVRFSGVSISYALGAVLGGAFSPLIATWLSQLTGSSVAVVIYLSIMLLIGAGTTLALRDRTGTSLGPDAEAEQSRSVVAGVR